MTKLEKMLEQRSENPGFMSNMTRREVIPAEKGSYRDYPPWLNAHLKEALAAHGIDRLYSHQAAAIEASGRGENVVVVTPTASGKTLCYNLPVLNTIMAEPETRALYLFPTKALSQDQVAELHELAGGVCPNLNAYTYDGDTEPGLRQSIRRAGNIVVTNPDMLHGAILPHHTK